MWCCLCKVEDKYKGKKVLASITEVVNTSNEIANLKEVRGKIHEGGFEAKLNVIALPKGLIYFQGKLRGINVSLLLDSGATNLFVNEQCVERLGLETNSMAKSIKVGFAQDSIQAIQVAKGLCFKCGVRSFKENFTMCSLDEVDFILGNTILHYYSVEIRQRPKLKVVAVSDKRKPKSLPFARNQF